MARTFLIPKNIWREKVVGQTRHTRAYLWEAGAEASTDCRLLHGTAARLISTAVSQWRPSDWLVTAVASTLTPAHATPTT